MALVHVLRQPYRLDRADREFQDLRMLCILGVDLVLGGDAVRETEWVELIAETVRPELEHSDHSCKIRTQFKIPYGYEIRAYREEPEAEEISFATDFIVIEESDGSWK